MKIRINLYTAEYYEVDYNIKHYFSTIKKKATFEFDVDSSLKVSDLTSFDPSFYHLQSFILEDNRLNACKEFIIHNNGNDVIWNYRDEDYSIEEYFRIFDIYDYTINLANGSEIGGDSGILDVLTIILEVYENANGLASSNPLAYDFLKLLFPFLILNKVNLDNFVSNLVNEGASFRKLSSLFESNTMFELKKLMKLLKTEDEELVKSFLEVFKYVETEKGIYIKK